LLTFDTVLIHDFTILMVSRPYLMYTVCSRIFLPLLSFLCGRL